MPDVVEGNGINSDAIIRKLAGFQTLIPQYDNISAITPKYFIDNVEQITSLAECTEPEKLLILRSRIRGDALTSIIHSPDLNQEKDYNTFKNKFLAYFDTKYSLGARQRQFSDCRMLPRELARTYADKVAVTTQNFFSNPDLTNPQVKNIFENTKLAKFIEGLLPNYKQSVVLKDPKTFQEAVEFLERLQSNESSPLNTEPSQTVNTVGVDSSKDELKSLIEAHTLHTQQMVNTLTKEIENLKLQTQQNSTRAQENSHSDNPQRRFANSSYQNQNRNFEFRNSPSCRFCNKNSHYSSNCYYNPDNKRSFRGRSNFQRYGRGDNSQRNTGRGTFTRQSRGGTRQYEKSGN